MSFSNLLYDRDTTLENMTISYDMLRYRFDKPVQSSECYSDDPHKRIQRSGANVDSKYPMIDVDSEMLGLTRKASKSIDKQYNPETNDYFKENITYPDCNKQTVEHTRLSNPPSTLRGSGWNRWENLLVNPQRMEHIELPFCNNVDTAILEKDNHRPLLSKLMVQPHQPDNCPVSLSR